MLVQFRSIRSTSWWAHHKGSSYPLKFYTLLTLTGWLIVEKTYAMHSQTGFFRAATIEIHSSTSINIK